MTHIREGIVDILQGFPQPVYTNLDFKNKSYRVRIKVKEGVTNFYNIFTGTSYYKPTKFIFDGEKLLSDTEVTEFEVKGIITFVFSGTRGTLALDNLNNLSRFFSQIDTLYDPIPDIYIPQSGNIIIDSLEFKAPNGIFSNNYSRSYTFNGSTFKVAPRIYSEYAMSKMTNFPPVNSVDENRENAYWPFKDCPNVESIEYQGDLDANVTKILTRCNFEILDRYGRSDTSAWPKVVGEFNGNIFGYVSASYPTLSNTTRLFDSFGKDCKYIYKPWDVEQLLIDYSGTYNLPIWGFSFENCENMERLIFQDTQFALDIDLDGDYVRESIENGADIKEENENLNIQFSFSSLGIQAPKSCRKVENLHNIFSVFFIPWRENSSTRGEDIKMNHVTPSFLKNTIYSWGDSLESLWAGNFEKDENDVPLVPSGMDFLGGYYNKVLCGLPSSFYTAERLARPHVDFKNYNSTSYGTILGDWRMDNFNTGSDAQFMRYCRELTKDGEYFQITVPAIDNKLLPDAGLRCYLKNTYAHNVIRNAITMPGIPTQVKAVSQCFAGTLAFSQGVTPALTRDISAYSLQYFYDTPLSPDLSNSTNHIKATKTMTGELKNILDNGADGSFKIKQIAGATAEQKEQFGDEVNLSNTPLGKTYNIVRQIVDGTSPRVMSDDNRFFGIPNIPMVAYEKGLNMGLDARSINEDFEENNSSMLNEVIRDVLDSIRGTNSALNSVYSDYPNTVPDSSLEHSFSNATELDNFIRDFAEAGESASYENYLIDVPIIITNNDAQNTSLQNETALQYRFAFMSELNLEREDIGLAIIKTLPSNYRGYYLYQGFYTIPPFIDQSSPIIVFDGYIERYYKSNAFSNEFLNKLTSSESTEFRGSNLTYRVGHNFKIAMVKKLLDSEVLNDLRFDSTNLLSSIPEYYNFSAKNHSYMENLFNPSVVKNTNAENRQKIMQKGYTNTQAGNMIGPFYSQGQINGSKIGYIAVDKDVDPIKVPGLTVDNLKTKEFNFGTYDVVTDKFFIIQASKNYQTLDLSANLTATQLNTVADYGFD